MASNTGSSAPRGATNARARRSASGAAPEADPPKGAEPSPRELIVVAEEAAGLRAAPDGVTSVSGADVSDLASILDAAGAALSPLFGVSEDHLVADALDLRTSAGAPDDASGADVPDLSVYYRVEAPDEDLDHLCQELSGAACVTAAYVKPGAEPPAAPALLVEPAIEPAASAMPASASWQANQGYLGPSPAGVNALWAHTQPGGRGAGVRIIDVEGAWQLGHEDLQQHLGGVISGSPTADLGWRNHGTAVIGVYGGDTNGFGVTGIAPDADCSMASIFGASGGSARAIRDAADRLGAGDIILIELHRPGPRHGFAARADQRGYIAIEWWPDDFAAIRYAIARGVIVVEAAGNGAENLDDALYDTNPGFPSTWRNPFNPANPSSQAVLVGAGAPPPGTHGRNHGDDRSRLDFSNHGRRVDAQGWGREVTTTGGRGGSPGDLQGGTDETLWYTDTFSGTSSASPVVVGALACIQGILRARGQAALTPPTAIAALRATGSPQQNGPAGPATQRIGNRPDIRGAIDWLAPPVMQGIATHYWLELLALPAGSARSLWLLVDGTWRHLDDPTPIQQDEVQRAFIDGTQEIRAWYQGPVVVGLVVHGA